MCISVVIPSYNASKFLPKAIESVKNQTYLPKELIVIDDGSSDNTREILKDIKLPFDFRLLTNGKNRGRSYSRNLGVKESACEFIAFLDADDIFFPHHLEELSKKDKDLVYSIPRTFINEEDKITRVSKKPYKDLKSMILGAMVGYPSGVMVKKATFLGFDENLHQREDWELFLRYYKEGLSIELIDKNTVGIREHGKRTSRSKEYFYYTMKVYEIHKDIADINMYLSISETAFRFKEKSIGFKFLLKALKSYDSLNQNPKPLDMRRLWNIVKRIPKI